VACHTVNIEDSEGVDDGSECALSCSRFFILAGDVLDMLSRKWKQTELLGRVRWSFGLGLNLGQFVQYRVMTSDRRFTRLRYSWALGSIGRSLWSRRVCAISWRSWLKWLRCWRSLRVCSSIGGSLALWIRSWGSLGVGFRGRLAWELKSDVGSAKLML
jgi:hypothetical protein